MIKNIDKAYVAGLFDGEGCIHINKHPAQLKNGAQYDLLVQIKMCDGRLLPEIHKRFGGNLRLDKRSLVNPKHSDILVWRIACQRARLFLEDILPYLKLKRRQAEIAIAFQENMFNHGGHSLITEEEIASRENYYKEMRNLKSEEKKYRLL